MFNSKYSNVLTVLLIIAIVGIIAIIGYLGYSVYNKYMINKQASEAVEEFNDAISNTVGDSSSSDGSGTIGNVVEGESIYSTSSSGTTTYYGYDVVGTISIPSISIEYPILAKVTTNSLKVAVAYLCGAGVNQVGNTVIQGHNLRNGLFFSNLSKLSSGDTIYLTDTTGTKIKYAVYNVFTAEGTDTSFYDRDTDGAREITLSTCTSDSAIKTIVLAKEVTEE